MGGGGPPELVWFAFCVLLFMSRSQNIHELREPWPFCICLLSIICCCFESELNACTVSFAVCLSSVLPSCFPPTPFKKNKKNLPVTVFVVVNMSLSYFHDITFSFFHKQRSFCCCLLQCRGMFTVTGVLAGVFTLSWPRQAD